MGFSIKRISRAIFSAVVIVIVLWAIPVGAWKMGWIPERLRPSVAQLRKNPVSRWMLNWASETQARTRLRKIAAVLALYEMDRGALPKHIEGLVAAGFLGPEFKGGKVDDYRYFFGPFLESAKIYAVPADPALQLQSFVLDSQDGKIKQLKNNP